VCSVQSLSLTLPVPIYALLPSFSHI
jgi:hypothetical protein